MQQVFLWGGRLGDRKIVWANWDSLSYPKNYGGFGVKDLEIFNKALVGKWAWRAIQGGEALWIEIVSSNILRSGVRGSGRDLLNPDKKVRGWWGEVLACLKDSRGDWFESCLARRVGNGESTRFWQDHWVGSAALCELFPRLFRLGLDKNVSVACAGEWVEDRWVWGLEWRREFRDSELTFLKNLVELMVCRKAKENSPDRWLWSQEADNNYSVKSGYKFMMKRKWEVNDAVTSLCKLLWNNAAVQKAKATAWRVIFRKIATTHELSRRGVPLPQPLLRCAFCKREEETVDHLFFECTFAWNLWFGILNWIGLQSTMINKAAANLLQFCSLIRGKKKKKVMATVWVCSIWALWNTRNNIVFNNGLWKYEKILGEIKSNVWCWMSEDAKLKESALNFQSWWGNPRLI